MGLRRASVLFLGLPLGLAACGSNDDKATPVTRAGRPGDSALAPTNRERWFPGLERMLLVPAHSADRALVVMADSLEESVSDGTLKDSVTLMRLDGSAVAAKVSVSQGADGCIEAALEPAPSSSWGAGFVGRPPRSIAVDSLRGLSRQDSSALTRAAFRIASGVPNDASGRFSGLPFALADLWRMRLSDGSTVLVATTKRQINQEDSPLEERTFIVAESDAAAPDGYSVVYSNRSTGPEETVEGRELLAAIAFDPTPVVDLVVGHDFGDRTSYSIIERSGPGKWALRWSTRRFSC